MKLNALLGASLLALTAAAPALAATVNPISYDMHNGHGVASSGSFNYWDKAYSGSGSTTTDNALLSGGLGDLTDGVTTNLNWVNVENLAGTGPYVGWRKTVLPTLAITFNFASPVNIDTIRLHADDSGGFGGVSLPSRVDFTWATGSAGAVVVDPSAGTEPSWLDFTGLGITGASSVTVTVGYGNEWIFLDEVQFIGAPVPEPSTYALMALGLAGMVAVARRRRDR